MLKGKLHDLCLQFAYCIHMNLVFVQKLAQTNYVFYYYCFFIKNVCLSQPEDWILMQVYIFLYKNF